MSDLEVIEPFRPVQVQLRSAWDLDGTLVKSETLLDSVDCFGAKHPQALLFYPIWAARGKAHLKARVSALALLDAAHLPYNRAVVEYLRRQRAARPAIFTSPPAPIPLWQSASPRFSESSMVFWPVTATSTLPETKNSSSSKAVLAPKGFDDVGNAIPDLPLSRGAPSGDGRQSRPAVERALPPAKRPGQPAIHRPHQPGPQSPAPFAFISGRNERGFSTLLGHLRRVAGQGMSCLRKLLLRSLRQPQIFNDLLDLESDRAHLTERNRAFASGDLSVLAGVGISAVLRCLFGNRILLPQRFFIFLALYLVTTIAYSFYLKRIVLWDVWFSRGSMPSRHKQSDPSRTRSCACNVEIEC